MAVNGGQFSAVFFTCGLFHVPGKYWERDDDEWHRLVVASLIGHEWLRLMALTA